MANDVLAVRCRLVDRMGIGFYDAEQWLRAWEDKAEELGQSRHSRDYWDEGERWITAELAVGRRQSN